jgi:L-asparaginase / beta-aspartyl-peptidase
MFFHSVAGIVIGLAAGLGQMEMASADGDREPAWSIVVHGGAGVIERGDMDEATETAYREALEAAVTRGGTLLREGRSAQEVVELVIRDFEDDPKFNSGRGAVFTAQGTNELDASIMRGSDLAAGAVAGVREVRHPISLAIAVMEDSPHVMLSGEGAEAFALEQGLEVAPPSHFFTERRWQSMERALRNQGLPVPARPEGVPAPEPIEEGALDLMEREHAFGTVGVVVKDRNGDTVAGTSTGGTTAKRWGRIGDSPVIGAGTYAIGDCGVSATGTGEYFIRLAVAARICMNARDGVLDAAQAGQLAADRVIQADLTALGGDGGIVMLYRGVPVWSFNTPGMYRASLVEGEEPRVAIYADEG